MTMMKLLVGSNGRCGQAMMEMVESSDEPDTEEMSCVILNCRGKASETRFAISMENNARVKQS